MLTPPSPSISPSLSPSDVSSTSRKRQRSLSMDSESSSSSPKRSVSLDPNQNGHDTPRPKDMSTLSISDARYAQDVDAYMAEQGDDVLPISNGQLTNGGRALTPQATALSPAQKLDYIERLRKQPMQIGQTWYIVSRRWFKRWQKACSGEIDKEGQVNEEDLGPVDNGNLVDTHGRLSQPCAEGVDVEFIPGEAWDAFCQWYGQSRCPLPRQVIGRGMLQEPALELHPPRLRAYAVVPDLVNPPSPAVEPEEVVVSSTDTVSHLRKALIHSLFPSAATDGRSYRVWKFDDPPAIATYVTIKDLQDAHASILEEDTRKVDEALIEPDDVFAIESTSEDGKWLVPDNESSTSGSSSSRPDLPPTPQSTEGEVQAPRPLFGSGADFFSKLQKSTSPPVASTSTSLSVIKPTSKAGPSRDPRLASKVCTLTPGTLGLGNMGNTCFMNSAIQCLAHTKELTDYFLSGVYEDELNPDNPLGMKGAIAEAFGSLLRRIWEPAGSNTSYSPRDFKQVLQKFAPQFSGYQQHDSQELVAFLLDGLHEDLNRVRQKPYVEKPDWEGGGDKELVDLANASWDGYKKRNDSVIVDLFQGQYQSTLVCPECSKVSITFDPFMYLTLPLPVKKKWRHTVYYVPWDLDKPHVKIPIEVNRDASFKDVRALLGRWLEVNPDNLLTLELFNFRIYKNLDDNVLVSDMSDSDEIVCFELPCHSQQSRTYKKQEGDPFVVPVILAETPRNRSGFNNGNLQMFAKPFIIIVDQKQATSLDVMYDLVVERLQRWTKHVRDLSRWEVGSPSTPMEEVPIPITTQPPVDSLTEIVANGDVVTVQEVVPEEGDIADEKSMVVQDSEDDSMELVDEIPHRVGFKTDLFRMHVQPSNAQYGVGYGSYPSHSRGDSWAVRKAKGTEEEPAVLLRLGDTLICEFDENVQGYYFGESGKWEHATWSIWDEFIHPEYQAALDARGEKKSRGVTLQDCLDEFTKEEQLGEEDPWYCPRCKKHQQATKRFDLWSVPDVLVVHLKRFSNSRALRDKIDAFVEFPTEGLDLTSMVRERQVARSLAETGVDVQTLGLQNVDDPVIYDLFAVDEHMGGLGGGHYRAYSYNEGDKKWHHFDDSYVTESTAKAAVNSNAYLLFYRRRAAGPLGGKTHEKIEAARAKAAAAVEAEMETDTEDKSELNEVGIQLPTPPSESDNPFESRTAVTWHDGSFNRWEATESSKSQSSASSPPPLDDGELPTFDESQQDEVLQSNLDPLQISAQHFDYPNPSSSDSPSSVQAEWDRDQDLDLDGHDVNDVWDSQPDQMQTIKLNEVSAPHAGADDDAHDTELSDL